MLNRRRLLASGLAALPLIGAAHQVTTATAARLTPLEGGLIAPPGVGIFPPSTAGVWIFHYTDGRIEHVAAIAIGEAVRFANERGAMRGLVADSFRTEFRELDKWLTLDPSGGRDRGPGACNVSMTVRSWLERCNADTVEGAEFVAGVIPDCCPSLMPAPLPSELSVVEITDGGEQHWFVARSVEDAIALYRSTAGYTWEQFANQAENVRELPCDEVLQLHQDTPEIGPGMVTMTARDWCADVVIGRYPIPCPLGCTNY